MTVSNVRTRFTCGLRARLLLSLLAAVALGCRTPARQPPIILIMVDTLRADYLGAYGFDGDISPHIDAFAAESVLFEKCFSQAPWTKPAIASLFTSLQPAVHQVLTHEGKFGVRGATTKTGTVADSAVTLAEALSAGGYATGAFVANPWIRRSHGFGQGFDLFDSSTSGNATLAGPVFAAARKWIGELPSQRPYLAYVHVMDVHGPYDAPEEDFEAVRASPEFGSEPMPLTQREVRRTPSYLRRSPWAQRSAGDVRVWRGRYAANVRAFDRRLGEFIDQLRADGTLDRAFVLIMSDHGEQLYDHGGWDHGNSLYDEELHVPLLVRQPGGYGGGRRVGAVVSLIDVMPTLIGFAGAARVEGMQGRDLGPFFAPEPANVETAATFATGVKWRPALQSVRTERYKLIKNSERPHAQLYDLDEDPGEKANIAGSSRALAAIEEILEAQKRRNQARGMLPAGREDIPQRVRERLRALGYDLEAPRERNSGDERGGAQAGPTQMP